MILLSSFRSAFGKLILLLALFISSCQENKTNDLHEGDILFQDLNCGDLCDAIESVTDGVNGRDFSHCAMVVKENDQLMVVEAIGDKVQLNSIKDFYARSGDTAVVKNIVVCRVKNEFADLVPASVAFAKAQVNLPYDDEFIMNNGSYYCSELIYDAFKHANQNQDFFALAPMTFKDPKTNDFFPAWVNYYKDLGKSIPEHEPGINPGLISRSDKLSVME